MLGKPNTLCKKEANLIKQKCMTQETVAQNIKKHLKSSIENEKIEETQKDTNAWTILPGPWKTVSR